MKKLLPVILLLSLGCGTPEKKAPEPTVEQAPPNVDPEKVLNQLQLRATMAQLHLQNVGVIRRDDDPVDDVLFESTAENLQERLSALADELETKLADFRETKRAAKAAPSVQKTIKVGKRKFVFESTLLDVQKITCEKLGSDMLLCTLSFKVLRSHEGIRFQMVDADGAQLTMPTVGISERIKNGVLTNQEIILPLDISTLTFYEL